MAEEEERVGGEIGSASFVIRIHLFTISPGLLAILTRIGTSWGRELRDASNQQGLTVKPSATGHSSDTSLELRKSGGGEADGGCYNAIL